MAAVSTDPLRLAVLNALTVATGKPRAIGSSFLFKAGSPAEVAQNPADLKKAPRCFVLIRDDAPDQSSVLQGLDIQRVWVTVQISLWYWMGSDVLRSRVNGTDEVGLTLARVAADKLRIVAALCQPNALVTDPTSRPTGLDGGSLRGEAWSCVGPVPLPTPSGDTSERVLKVDFLFRTFVELTQPT